MDFSTLFSNGMLTGRRRFQKGDMLLYPDSEQYAILFLESGTVEVSRYDTEGERILQSFMGAPMFRPRGIFCRFTDSLRRKGRDKGQLLRSFPGGCPL